MVIDHICFVVRDIDEGVNFWIKTFGYSQFTKPVINRRQKVKVVFLRKDNSLTIKIIEPLENNAGLKDFLGQYFSKFHHICFRCDDINTGVAMLKEKGLRLIVPPQPGEAFENNLIAFFIAEKCLNFEIIDTNQKAEIIANVL